MSLLLQRRIRQSITQAGTSVPVRSLALMGNNSGVVATGTGNLIYVRMLSNGQTIRAVNYDFPNEWGRLVKIEYVNGQMQVVEMLSPYNQADDVVRIPPHDHSYYTRSANVTWVYPAQFLPLLVLPKEEFTVRVHGGIVKVNGTRVRVEGEDLDLTSYVPTNGARWVLITFDTSGGINVTSGTVYDTKSLLTINNVPVSSEFDIAAVQLYVGQESIRRDQAIDDILDLRYLGAGAASGSGTGGGAFQRNLAADLTLEDGECLIVVSYINQDDYDLVLQGDADLVIYD